MQYSVTCHVLADPEPTSDPTPEQLAATKEVYAQHGLEYRGVADPKAPGAGHCFRAKTSEIGADLKGLPDLPFRFAIDLNSTNVTDACLDLSKTRVTSKGLQSLVVHKRLTILKLSYTRIADEGLSPLKEIKGLKELHLIDAGVTDYHHLKQILKNPKTLTVLHIWGKPDHGRVVS